MNTLSLFDFDKMKARQLGTDFLVGIDEAGRGPLAGPVVACACYIPPSIAAEFSDVNDSKKLTESKREELFERLTHANILYNTGFATAYEIDHLNILQATFLAMRRAAQRFIRTPQAIALVDGPHKVTDLDMEQLPVVDGDAQSLAIAAASVIAKVTRDRYMTVLDKLYPGYDFAVHKGYGTAKHLQALHTLGPCLEHRASFGPVRKLVTSTRSPLP